MNEFVEVKTAELIGPALRYAVAAAEGLGDELRWCFNEDGAFHNIWTDNHGAYWPDEDWEIGGYILDRLDGMKIQNNKTVRNVTVEKLEHWYNSDPNAYRGWSVKLGHDSGRYEGRGDSTLIALCRAVVAAKLGATVSVPKELQPC